MVATLLRDPQVAYLCRGSGTEQGQSQRFNHSSICLMFLFTTLNWRHMNLYRLSWSCQWSILASCNSLKMAQECLCFMKWLCVLIEKLHHSVQVLDRCGEAESRIWNVVNFQLPWKCYQIQYFSDSAQLDDFPMMCFSGLHIKRNNCLQLIKQSWMNSVLNSKWSQSVCDQKTNWWVSRIRNRLNIFCLLFYVQIQNSQCTHALTSSKERS